MKVAMTVEELVQVLQNYPADMRVVVDGYEEGYGDLEQDLISVQEIRLDVGSEWWEGRHRDSWDVRAERSGIVKALLLRRPWNQGNMAACHHPAMIVRTGHD